MSVTLMLLTVLLVPINHAYGGYIVFLSDCPAVIYGAITVSGVCIMPDADVPISTRYRPALGATQPSLGPQRHMGKAPKYSTPSSVEVWNMWNSTSTLRICLCDMTLNHTASFIHIYFCPYTWLPVVTLYIPTTQPASYTFPPLYMVASCNTLHSNHTASFIYISAPYTQLPVVTLYIPTTEPASYIFLPLYIVANCNIVHSNHTASFIYISAPIHSCQL
jgi:hypothetical protein